MIAYTVHCAFADADIQASFTRYLVSEHVGEVCAVSGASATIVTVDGERACEVRYVFKSREALEAYFRDEAPRLREHAERHMGTPSRVTLTRRTGEILHPL